MENRIFDKVDTLQAELDTWVEDLKKASMEYFDCQEFDEFRLKQDKTFYKIRAIRKFRESSAEFCDTLAGLEGFGKSGGDGGDVGKAWDFVRPDDDITGDDITGDDITGDKRDGEDITGDEHDGDDVDITGGDFTEPPIENEPSLTDLEEYFSFISEEESELSSFSLLYQEVQVKTWEELLIEVCEILLIKRPYIFIKIPSEKSLNQDQVNFSFDKEDIAGKKARLSNKIWVNTEKTADEIREILDRTLKFCGYDTENLAIKKRAVS